MKRAFIASGVILSALLMGAMLWERGREPAPSQHAEETPNPTSSEESQPISARSRDKSGQTEPSYSKLGIAFAWVPEQPTAQLGYYDQQAKAFYAWKGVVFPVEQIPGFNNQSASRSAWTDPLDIRALTVTEVDAPSTYYMPLPDGDFAPGFYDGRFSPRFYRWKGLRLKKEQIPAEAFKKHVLPDGLVKVLFATIDPPQYARK